jgi:hypothetical protein
VINVKKQTYDEETGMERTHGDASESLVKVRPSIVSGEERLALRQDQISLPLDPCMHFTVKSQLANTGQNHCGKITASKSLRFKTGTVWDS